MKRLDAVAGKGEGVEHCARAGRGRRFDLAFCHFEPGGAGFKAIKFFRVVGKRAIAAGGDIVNDGAHRRLDVGRNFARSIEKGAKAVRKIGGACIEADGHY